MQRLLVFVLFFFALSLKAEATLLVVIYTSDGYWIGADGVRYGAQEGTQKVCKIHETKFGLLAKSGDVTGQTESGEKYSIDKEVEELIASNNDPRLFMEETRTRFKSDIEKEIVLFSQNPFVNAQNLESRTFQDPLPSAVVASLTRVILLFNSDSAVGGVALQVQPQSDSIQGISGEPPYRYWAPSIFGGQHPLLSLPPVVMTERGTITFPASVRMFAHPVQYDRPDEWVKSHPYEAMKEILDLGHKDAPREIGPPYSIVHVLRHATNKLTVEWKVRGMCPGWSEQIK